MIFSNHLSGNTREGMQWGIQKTRQHAELDMKTFMSLALHKPVSVLGKDSHVLLLSCLQHGSHTFLSYVHTRSWEQVDQISSDYLMSFLRTHTFSFPAQVSVKHGLKVLNISSLLHMATAKWKSPYKLLYFFSDLCHQPTVCEKPRCTSLELLVLYYDTLCKFDTGGSGSVKTFSLRYSVSHTIA